MENIAIQLSPQEVAVFKPFCDHCDARIEGYKQGIEDAKKALLQHILSTRKPQEKPVNDTVPTT